MHAALPDTHITYSTNSLGNRDELTWQVSLSFSFTAIRQLWGEGHHQAEIDDIMREKATMKNTKILSVLELMKEPAFRWQLYTIVTLTATMQLCGISAVECISPLKSQNTY